MHARPVERGRNLGVVLGLAGPLAQQPIGVARALRALDQRCNLVGPARPRGQRSDERIARYVRRLADRLDRLLPRGIVGQGNEVPVAARPVRIAACSQGS